MNIRLAPLVILMLFGADTAFLQTTEGGQPETRYVKVPERASWTIWLENQNGTEGGNALVRIDCEKDVKLQRNVFKYADGSQKEAWYVEDYRLVADTQNTRAFISDPAADAVAGGAVGMFSGKGIPGLSWLDEKYYVGVEKFDKRECFYFEMPGGENDLPIARAWIDRESRLPVAFELGRDRFRFRTGKAPANQLRLPDIFAKAWQRFEALEKRRKLMQEGNPE